MIVLARDTTTELRILVTAPAENNPEKSIPVHFRVTDIGLGEVASATDQFRVAMSSDRRVHMGRTRSPKPLTGGKVFLMLVAFFGVVIAVNLVMMRFAIQTLPGTEVDSAYSASLAYEKEIATARDQSARDWKVDAHVARSGQGGATLRGRSARQIWSSDVRSEVSRPVRAADRPAGRSSGRSR